MFSFEGISDTIADRIKPLCESLYEVNQTALIAIHYIQEPAFKYDVKTPIKLVVILRELPLDILRKNLKLVRAGVRRSIPAPLFLTQEHIVSSADVFPIEFITMKAFHTLIFGRDILSHVVIDDANLRLQCEQELKGKLIHLRQSYLERGLSNKDMKILIRDSFRSFVPIFRCMLLLKKQDISNTPDVLHVFSDVYDVDISLLRAIYSLEYKTLSGKALNVFFGNYVSLIAKIATISDLLMV